VLLLNFFCLENTNKDKNKKSAEKIEFEISNNCLEE
jgi:hypothetical protein